MDHREFAAHLIRGERIAGLSLHASHNVEERSRRLHHHHVGALLDVLKGFAQCLVRVGDVHLVPATIAILGCALGRLTERAVERTGELGGITENSGVLEPVGIECAPDSADSPVHHVARRDDVGASACVRQRFAHEQCERRVVVHVALAQDAAVAVISVLAQADVRDHDELRQLPLECPHRLRHGPVIVPRAGPFGVLDGGNAKQQHAPHA